MPKTKLPKAQSLEAREAQAVQASPGPSQRKPSRSAKSAPKGTAKDAPKGPAKSTAKDAPKGPAKSTAKDAGAAQAALKVRAQEDAAFPHWKSNKYALSGGAFFLSVGFALVQPFLPLMFRELGVKSHLETWVGVGAGGYFLISFVMLPMWGAVADHIGRRMMVLRTSLGMACVFLVLPYASGPLMFCAVYMLMGLTNGYNPAAQALISTNTPSSRAGEALSLLITGGSLGATMAPVLAATLIRWLAGYVYLCWVAFAGLLITATLCLTFVRESFTRPSTPFRINMLTDLRAVLRLPNVRVLFMCQFIYTLNFYGLVPVISLYIIELLETRGVTEGTSLHFWIGAVPFAFSIVAAASAPLWGKVLGWLDIGMTLLGVLCLSALLSIPTFLVQNMEQLLVARAIVGLSVVGIGPAAVMLIRLQAPKGMESRVLSYGAAFSSLGLGSGPLLAGMIAPVLGLRPFFALNSLALMVIGLCWLRSMRRGLGVLSTSALRKL